MEKLIPLLIAALLAACAEVPYDKNGRVMVPSVANFSQEAAPGPIDKALEELRIQIEPGADNARIAMGLTLTAIVACQITDCRPSQESRRFAMAAAAKSLEALHEPVMMIERFGDVQIRVAELATVSEAIAEMAERDNQALDTSVRQSETASWVALYKTRLEMVLAARNGAVRRRDQINEFIAAARKSDETRVFAYSAIGLRRAIEQDIVRIDASLAMARVAVAAMEATDTSLAE